MLVGSCASHVRLAAEIPRAQITDEELIAVARKMKGSLSVRDRRWGFNIYPQCFVGMNGRGEGGRRKRKSAIGERRGGSNEGGGVRERV